MIKLFVKGFVFGTGFAIAIAIAIYLNLVIVENNNHSSPPTYNGFHTLDAKDQIETASVIMLVTITNDSNDELKPYISDFLKKEVDFRYEIGEIYPLVLDYTKHAINGDQVVIMFIGNSPERVSSSRIIDGYVYGLDDMSLEQIRKVLN